MTSKLDDFLRSIHLIDVIGPDFGVQVLILYITKSTNNDELAKITQLFFLKGKNL